MVPAKRRIKGKIKMEVNLKGIVKALCKGKENWNAVNEFAQGIMRMKKKNEREKLERRNLEEGN